MVNLKDFPAYAEDGYRQLMNYYTPVERVDGYYYKRDDYFSLGGLLGGKVRQCLSLVHHNLPDIRSRCSGGLATSAGLPSPQSCIMAGVARYFGLQSAVAVFRYDNTVVDFNRINVSLAQKLGATIYGVDCPRKSSVDKAGRELARSLNYYHVDFGMAGTFVMDVVANQCNNIPDDVESIVIVAGSGFSALGVALGAKKFDKNISTIYVVCLSNYFNKNKRQWYDVLDGNVKFKGDLVEIKSPIPYHRLYNPGNDFRFDLTYESKAHQWMLNYIKPNGKTLFWVVGKREYNINYVEPINWHELPPRKGLLF